MSKPPALEGDHAVDVAIAELRAGRAVLVSDDADRENEFDLVFAAQFATPELTGFVIRHTSGVLCCALGAADCDRLELPQMVARNQEYKRTAFTVSVDAARDTTTGISASDRATTFRRLADAGACASDFVRPGHVFPLRAHGDGVLGRRGHTEAALDLMVEAELRPAGVLCELVDDHGQLLRGSDALAFAETHRLAVLTIEDLVRHRTAMTAASPRIAS